MAEPSKNVAKIDLIKAVTGVSFATLAAIGGASGNPMIAGFSALPSAGLASYDIIGDQLLKLKTPKKKYLELPLPPWWTNDISSWQGTCAEIGNRIQQILEAMQERMHQEQQVITKDLVQQIFIEAVVAQHLTWQPDMEQKRLIGEFIAAPILQKLDEILKPIIEQIQQEGALIDHRKAAFHTAQTVQVLEKIHQGMSKAKKVQALSEEEIATIRKQYCEVLYNRWKMLDFKGIMHVDMNHPISIPLTDVFIFPDLLFGIPEYETLERESEEFLYGNHPRHKAKQVLPQREMLHSVLAKYSRLVLLGDPGSGKSTLLRYLLLQLVQGSDIFAAAFPQMRHIATAVPLYMPLTAFAEVLVSNAPGRRSLEDFLPIYLQDNYLGAYVNFIQGQLQQGNLLVLFDGLDEIPDASLRMHVVRHLEMFSQFYSANRFIVTSRIVGYKEAALSSEYQPYTLADFNEEQVKTFTQRWCPAYEYWVRGTREGQYLEEAATKEAEGLFHATQCRPAVKRLAVNPLLLTILALIQRQGIELPSHRVELFELCAMTLIDTWIKAKGQTIRFSKNDLIKILRPLAFWMHEHPAVGAIPEEELQEHIVRQLIGRSIHEYEAMKLAELFLETVRGKTGILVERGKQRYGFLHLTFEEYFAARELEKRKDRNDFIKTHLHHPRWREVILLTVGAIGILQSDEEEVTQLVHHTIAKAGSTYELILHRDLLLAGRCLADDIGMRLASEDEIIEQLVYLYITSPYERLRTTISGVLKEWNGTRVAEKAAKLVLPLLHQWATSIDLHGIFTATSAFDEKIVRHIEQLSRQYRKVMERSTRFDLSIILAHNHALDEEELRENLLGVISDEKVRAKMIILFEQYKNRQLPILDTLLITLSDPDEDVKMKALSALEYLGDSQPRVIDALLTAISDNSPFIKRAAAKQLSQIGEKQSRIINALLEALVDIDFVKPEVLLALSQLGQGLPEVVDAQLAALVDIDSADVRQAATDVLGRLNYEIEHVIDILLATISDPDMWTINALARILGEISSNPAPMTDIFLSSFSDKAMARGVAINALGYIHKAEPHIIVVLLALASESETSTRIAAISALGRLKKGEPYIVNALLSCLSVSSWLVRREAITALERLGKDQPHIIDALLTSLSDSDYDVREAAVIALGRLAGEKQHVIKALLATLTDAEANVRAAAFIMLGQLYQAYPHVAEYISTALFATFEDDFPLKASHEHKRLLYQSFVERALNLLEVVEDDHINTIDVLFTDFFSSSDNLETLIRSSAARALGKIGKKQPHVVDALLLALDSPKQSIKIAAVTALGQLEKVQVPILDALVAMLSHTGSRVRSATTLALGKCGKGNAFVTDAIIQSLFDRDEDVRRSAANSLRQLGEKKPQIVDALIQALSDQSGQVRQFAAMALRDIGDEQPHVISALVQALFGPSWGQRQGAGFAIGKLGKGQPQIIDTLLPALSSPHVSIRAMAARTLGLVSDNQPYIIDALVLALSDYSYLVREEAARALGLLGEKQDRILEALLRSISDNSSSVRAAASGAFRTLYIGDGQLPILSILLQSLSDSSWGVRDGAANSLATSSSRRDIIEDKLESLMLEYEPIASRKLMFRGYLPIFDALQEFTKMD